MPTWPTIFKTVAVTLALLLALWLLAPALLPFGLGLLAALAVQPAVSRLQQTRLPRWAAAGLAVSGLYILLALLLLLGCRLLWQELTAFVRGLPVFLTGLSDLANQWRQSLLSLTDRLPPEAAQFLTDTITQTLRDGAGLGEKLYTWLFSLVSRLLTTLPDILLFLLTSLLSGFMLAAELPKLRRLWTAKAPEVWQSRASRLLSRFKNTLGSWLKAQMKLMAITALVLTAGLFILGMDYPLLFGLGIALIDALPVLGSGLILIPWGLVLFLQRQTFLGAGLLLLYGVAALIRTALEPRLLGKQMGLDPLLTLGAMYTGYHFFGVLGMVALPMAAMVTSQFLQDGN